MDQDLLSQLIDRADKAAVPLQPFMKKKKDAFQAAKAIAAERTPSGAKTPRANQALQRLRNPTLNTTHPAKAKGLAAAAVQQTGRTFSDSMADSLIKWTLHEQAKLELSLHDDDESASKYRSREDGPVEDKQDSILFYDAMKERGVPMSFLARLPGYKLDIIAKLGFDAGEDCRHENKENLWVRMFANGMLDCVRGSMSDDEALMLAEASTALEAPQDLILRDRLEERLGRPLDVTPGFAAGLQLILDEAHELSEAEARLMVHATARRRSIQIGTLERLLDFPPGETSQVEALVGFVENARTVLSGPIVDRRFGCIKHMLAQVVETFEDRKIPHSEWLPRIQSTLLRENGFIDRSLPDAETFWAILAAVLEESKTHELLRASRAHDEEAMLREHRRAQQEYLERFVVPYSVTEDGHVASGCPDGDDDGAVVHDHGGGVGTRPASAPSRVTLEDTADSDAQPSRPPELDPHPSSRTRTPVVMEILPPRASAYRGGDLFEGME